MIYRLSPEIYFATAYAAMTFGLEHNILLAVAKVESNMDNHVIGDGGHSVGAFQLHDQGAGAEMTVAQRMDWGTSARKAAEYLSQLWESTGTMQDALSAYNQGFGSWEKNGQQLNRPYVDAVNKAWMGFDRAGVTWLLSADNLLRW